MTNRKGRPIKNYRLHEIMRDKGCSRPWAYVLLRREQAMDKMMSKASKMSLEELESLKKAGIIKEA